MTDLINNIPLTQEESERLELILSIEPEPLPQAFLDAQSNARGRFND